MASPAIELPDEALELHAAWTKWHEDVDNSALEFDYRTKAAVYRQGHLLRSGEIIADRYQVRGTPCDGALAARWGATDLHEQRLVSVEILHANMVPVPGVVAAFHEAGKPYDIDTTDEAIERVVRPIDEGGEWEGFHWIATDGRGQPFTDVVADINAIDKRQILIDVGDALYQSHQHDRPHGALDPKHVLIDTDGTARLSGFSMIPPAFAGTAMSAPETADPNFKASPATDRYAFAMLIVWAELGELPYWAMRDPERLLKEFRPAKPLREALAASWALDPTSRPTEVSDLIRALRGDADNVRGLAERAVSSERWPTALGHYRQLLALTRGDADVRADLAICLAHSGQEAQAMDQLLACLRAPGLKRDQDVIAELLRLANASDDATAVPQVIEALTERLGQEGSQADVISLHIARLATGTAAIPAWEQAVLSHTERAQADEALRQLVRLTSDDGQWAAFVHWGGQLVDFEPAEAAGRLAFRVGEACQSQLRDPNGALFWLSRARDEGYDHTELHALLEALQTERGDWDELIDLLESKALDTDDVATRRGSLRRAARVARRAGRQPERAAGLYTKLLEDTGDSGAEALWFLARHSRKGGDLPAERQFLQRLDPLSTTALSPTLKVEAGLRLSVLLRDIDELEDAETLVRGLLSHFPDHTGVLRLAVALNRDAGRHAETHPLLLRLASIHQAPSEDWAQAMLARSEIMWRYGEWSESYLLAEEVHERLPNHPGASWGMARCLLGSNPLRDELGVDLSSAPYTPQEALARLLDLLIEVEALEAFSDADPLGPAAARSPLEKAAASVDRLLAHGAIETLFDRLTELCPERIDAIRLVERLWEPGGATGSFPIARTYTWNRVPVGDEEDVQRRMCVGKLPAPLWQAALARLDLEPLWVASSRSALPDEGGPASLLPHVPAENNALVIIANAGTPHQNLLDVTPFEAITIGSHENDTLVVPALSPRHATGVRVAGRMYLSGTDLTVRGRPVTEVRLRHGLTFALGDVAVRVMTASDVEEIAGDDLTDFLDEIEDSEVFEHEDSPTLFEEVPQDEVLALIRTSATSTGEAPATFLIPLVEERTDLGEDAVLEQEEDGLRLTHGPVSRFVVPDEYFEIGDAIYQVIRIESDPPNPPRAEGAELVPALILDDGTAMGSVVILDGPKTIGRARDVSIQIRNDAKVSRVHATIEPRGSGVVAVDHGASNGTYVGDERIEGERPLRPGDRLIIGDTVLEFRMWADEREENGDSDSDMAADTLMGATIRAASAPLTIEDGKHRLDVANRAIGAMLRALDNQDGAGAGRAELQLVMDVAPRRFKPIFARVDVQRTGLPVMPLLFNVAQLASTAQRAVLSSGLQDLIERSLQRFADLVEEEQNEQMLEAVARTNYRKHLRL